MKAHSCSSVQGGNSLSADFVIRFASTAECSASLGRKADTYLTRPRNDWVCVAFLGLGHERILLTFLLSGSIPFPCHIPYLTSNLSSPTPTFRTYLQPLLRCYLYFTSSYPFVAMQPPLLFLSISTSFYYSLFPYCLLLSLLPTCILTCNIRPLLSLLSMSQFHAMTLCSLRIYK